MRGAFIANFPRCSFQEKKLNGRAGRNCSRSCCAANENFMKLRPGFPERWPVPKPPGLLCIALMSVLDAHFEVSLRECGGRQV